MSSGPPKAVVERQFKVQEKACEQALTLLLQKKGGPTTAPEDTAKEIKNGCDATNSIQED